MIKYAAFFLLAVLSLNAKTTLNFDDTDRQIIFYTYNFQFDRAEQLLNNQFVKYPENLKYYFLSLGLKSMQIEKSVYDEKPAGKRELKTKMLEEAIKYADDVIEKFEDVEETTENKFYLGCIYGYLGRMHGVTRSWMSAFSDGKAGRNLLEEVIEEDPEFNDAYLLLGMFNYYGERMGGFIGFVAGVLGFSGDRDTGLSYILKTYNNGLLLSDQAELLLIELYSSLEGNGFAAIPLQRNFVKRYPNNYHMINWYVRDLLRYQFIDEAKSYIETDSLDYIDPALKAQLYHDLGDYNLSNKYLDESGKKFDFYYKGIQEHLTLLRTLNYWMMSDNRYKKYEQQISERFETITKSLFENEKLGKNIINVGVEFAKGKLSKSSLDLVNNPPEIPDKFLDVMLAYTSGVYFYQQKNYDEARKRFERVKFFDKENYHYSAIQYLIDIFGRIKVPTVKVEELLEEINNFEYENLSYWAKDLEKKYQLD